METDMKILMVLTSHGQLGDSHRGASGAIGWVSEPGAQ